MTSDPAANPAAGWRDSRLSRVQNRRVACALMHLARTAHLFATHHDKPPAADLGRNIPICSEAFKQWFQSFDDVKPWNRFLPTNLTVGTPARGFEDFSKGIR